MPKDIVNLRLENLRIKLILRQIEKFSGVNFSLNVMKKLFYNLRSLWNYQEKREKQILQKEKIELPQEVKLIDAHRELRGHWYVLQQALNSGNIVRLKVALDTDGRMLLEKAKTHIFEKEKFLKQIAL